MATFDIGDREERGWFDVEGGGRVEFRLPSTKDMKEMAAACIRKVGEYAWLPIDPDNPSLGKAHKRFERTETDWDLWNEMLWDFSIPAWEGLLDAQGREIPITRENKCLLMTMKDPAFRDLHEKSIMALKAAAAAQAEEAEKN